MGENRVHCLKRCIFSDQAMNGLFVMHDITLNCLRSSPRKNKAKDTKGGTYDSNYKAAEKSPDFCPSVILRTFLF